MEGTPQPFNVRAIYALKLDAHYRVYPRGDALFLVRIGGQRVGGYTTGLRIGFGLIGALIGELIQKKVEQSQVNRVWELDSRDPEQMVQTEKGSIVRVGEVISSSIEPGSAFGGHGEHHGKWLLRMRGEKPVTFQFETLQDMQVGIHALQATRGRRISVNVVSDNKRPMFLLLFQLLLGTNCHVAPTDYTGADRAYIAVAKVPSFFAARRCDAPPPPIDVFAGPSSRRKIAEVRWGDVEEGGGNHYCASLVFVQGQLCPRGELQVMEDGYEEAGLVVLQRSGRWAQIRLDLGHTGWVHLGKNDEVVDYGDLVIGRLAAFTQDWDGRIYDAPGGAMHRMTADRQEVTVDDWREVHGRLWFEVRVLDQSPCETHDPKVLATGWVHAYSNKKQPVVAHYPRGC